jgi:hypothetical protein
MGDVSETNHLPHHIYLGNVTFYELCLFLGSLLNEQLPSQHNLVTKQKHCDVPSLTQGKLAFPLTLRSLNQG